MKKFLTTISIALPFFFSIIASAADIDCTTSALNAASAKRSSIGTTGLYGLCTIDSCAQVAGVQYELYKNKCYAPAAPKWTLSARSVERGDYKMVAYANLPRPAQGAKDFAVVGSGASSISDYSLPVSSVHFQDKAIISDPFEIQIKNPSGPTAVNTLTLSMGLEAMAISLGESNQPKPSVGLQATVSGTGASAAATISATLSKVASKYFDTFVNVKVTKNGVDSIKKITIPKNSTTGSVSISAEADGAVTLASVSKSVDMSAASASFLKPVVVVAPTPTPTPVPTVYKMEVVESLVIDEGGVIRNELAREVKFNGSGYNTTVFDCALTDNSLTAAEVPACSTVYKGDAGSLTAIFGSSYGYNYLYAEYTDVTTGNVLPSNPANPTQLLIPAIAKNYKLSVALHIHTIERVTVILARPTSGSFLTIAGECGPAGGSQNACSFNPDKGFGTAPFKFKPVGIDLPNGYTLSYTVDGIAQTFASSEDAGGYINVVIPQSIRTNAAISIQLTPIPDLKVSVDFTQYNVVVAMYVQKSTNSVEAPLYFTRSTPSIIALSVGGKITFDADSPTSFYVGGVMVFRGPYYELTYEQLKASATSAGATIKLMP